MTTATRTPGPLSITEDKYNKRIYIDYKGESPRNLIAAAPELLECLELLHAASSNLPDTAYVDYLVQRVDKAINEAKGVQS
jgi:hypothetical protein